MKQLFGLLLILLSLQTVGQSKKKQIISLNQKIDSLQTLLNVERSNSEDKLSKARVQAFNLQEKITSLENQITQTKKLLKESETALSSKNQINKEQQDLIKKLKDELQVKEDSLNLLRNDEPIQLLPGNFFAVTDKELIKLFNVKDSDLGDDYVSLYEPTEKPKYSIESRQFFSLSGNNYLLAVMGVRNPNNDHMHVGTSFIACFKFTKNNIYLLKKPFDTFENAYGEFGLPPRVENIFLSGRNQLSVSMISFWNGDGNSLESRSLFSLDSNMNIHFSYSMRSHEDDMGMQGTHEWENIDVSFNIEFKPSCLEFYDLEERKYSHDKLKSKRTLRFNPSTYKYEPVK
jgi:hypothetical protein